MDKQDYITYLDRLLRDKQNFDICDYQFTLNHLASDSFTDIDVIEFDVYRRRLGLEDFYGTRELMIPKEKLSCTIALNEYEVYKDSLLCLGEVEFIPMKFYKTFKVNDIEVSYSSEEAGYFKIESGEIRNNCHLFFDIKNKKLITLEDSDFAEYEED